MFIYVIVYDVYYFIYWWKIFNEILLIIRFGWYGLLYYVKG